MSKIEYVGNALSRKKTHGGYAGDCFLPKGVSPALNTMEGGNRQPFILTIYEED